jgi:predicted ATPase/DNA-binding SARP family transcriptional activator/DNA-binding CsgD family transcriptional regulator
MVGEPEDIRLWLLGSFRVSVGLRTLEEGDWQLRKAASLVKLLALSSRHRLHREYIMELLWPESNRRAASNNLRQVIYAARGSLRLGSANSNRYFVSQDEQIALCPECKLWVDLEAFEEASATARRTREPAAYEAAIDLYAGDLLPGDRYESWAEDRRQELRDTYLYLLGELAERYEQDGDYVRAIDVLRRAAAAEPTREESHLALMRLYARHGRESEALRQYERLREFISRELKTQPSMDARHLREQIVTRRFRPTSPRPENLRQHQPPNAAAPRVDKSNLPAARTSFVGREREMLEVKRELAMTRLLTLTGVGGSGKTRLALEVARNLVGAYPDGVWLAALAPLSERELVPQALASALGIREQPAQPLADTLVEALRTKETLLTLDNCEHLVNPVSHLLDKLLDSCPHLRVLATSREALNVRGEVVRHVPPLLAPDAQSSILPVELKKYEAIRLFVERARLRVPGFELTAENAPMVATVCRKLEGIPLAIELATAWVGTLSIGQISERLQDTLGLLSTGGRTAVPRQQTLRGALDWSYDLLGELEQVLFRRLSAFAGGWTLEAAEAVGAGDGIEQGEVLNLLSRLVNKSLVTTDVDGYAAARYRMLEPVRRYAREKLEESGEAQAILHQHAMVFLALSELAEAESAGGRQQREWLGRLEQEHDNLRVALGWSFARGDTELGLKVAAALWEFWDTHGHLSEGRRWLERGIATSGTAMMETRAKALNGAGWIALFQGDYGAAKTLVDEGLTLYRELGDKEGIASALINLGHVAALSQQDLASLPALLEEAMELRPGLKDRRTVAHLLVFAGLVIAIQVLQGQLELHEQTVARFRALHEESLELFRESTDVRGMSICLTNLGLTESILGNYTRATALLRQLLHLALEADYRASIQYVFFGLANVAAAQDEPVRATRLWAAADAMRETSGMQLPPLARSSTNYEGRLSSVRAALGQESFGREWAEGQGMTLEQAVDYALSEKEPDTPAPAIPEHPTNLTPREEEIASLVARGLTNYQIASELVISDQTVATHVKKIRKKLGLSSRVQLAAWVAEQGLPFSNSQ